MITDDELAVMELNTLRGLVRNQRKTINAQRGTIDALTESVRLLQEIKGTQEKIINNLKAANNGQRGGYNAP